MFQNLKLQDIGVGITMALAVGGLVFSAASQVNINEQQSRDIDRIDRTMGTMDSAQREDHIAIVRMQEGITYLVDRAKRRETSR
jgi:hypothetical protein